MGNYGRMEKPSERFPEDFSRKGKSNPFKKKNSLKSVGLKTFKRGTAFVTVLVWIAFLAVVSIVGYYAISMFINN